MKIAVLCPQESPVMSWNMGRGLINTLERMGFETIYVQLPTLREADQKQLDEAKKKSVPIHILKDCDALIVSGPEHIAPWIEAVYERYEWKQLECPTAAWLHESMERDDYNIDFEPIKWIAKDWFFPAIQDAEKHDQDMFVKDHSHYLPIGVDTNMFRHPSHLGRYGGPEAEFPIAFIGGLYPKRIAFLQALSRHNHPPIRLGNVTIKDLRGFDNAGSTARYAENLRSIKVFLNLPMLSRMIGSKVFEVLACGGFLLSPQLTAEGGVSKNMAIFETDKHLVYYRSSNLPYVAQLLRDWSSDEFADRRQAIAEAGFREVVAKHTLEHRLTEMLAKMGVQMKQAVQ